MARVYMARAIIGRCRAPNYVRWGRASQFLHVRRLRGQNQVSWGVPATKIHTFDPRDVYMVLVVSVMRPCAIIGRCRALNYVRWGQANQVLHVWCTYLRENYIKSGVLRAGTAAHIQLSEYVIY